MPRQPLPPIEEHLTRVADETNKAAAYLAAAMAFRLVPRLGERWGDSPTQLGFVYLRQGTHMAFLVTLAALVEETGQDRVNLPRLLRRFNDDGTRRAIAASRALDSREAHRRVTALQDRFARRVRPLIQRVKDVRDNVVAHHGQTVDWPDTTIGLLNKTMVRVVVLVDSVSKFMTGEPTGVRDTISTVRWQAASFWSKGIDGDPDVAPGRTDDDEGAGL